MISCLVNETGGYIRIYDGNDVIHISFDMYYDDRSIRRRLLKLAGPGQVIDAGWFRGWSVAHTNDSRDQYSILRTVVDQYTQPRDRTVRISVGSVTTFITRGAVRLAICGHSHRRQRESFLRLNQLLRVGSLDWRGGNNGREWNRDFADLEDDISLANDYDSCYPIEPDVAPPWLTGIPSTVKRLMGGSVLA